MKKIDLETYKIGYYVCGYEQTEGGMNIHHHQSWTLSLSEAIGFLEEAEKNNQISNCDWIIVVDAQKIES